MASEDIGNADPRALEVALKDWQVQERLGSPEGELAIAQAVVYMACAPKSNASYIAFEKASEDVSAHVSLPVPLHLRNAPTKLMKALDYGKGYQYAHDFEDGLTEQQHLPAELAGRQYYEPKGAGREQRLKEYLDRFRAYRSRQA